MRRLLLAALVLALAVGLTAGIASARMNDEPAAPSPAPFRAPAAAPTADAGQPGAYAFRPSAAIAADLAGGAEAAPSAAPTSGAGAQVTVTATVLPVVFVVLGDDGDVDEIFTNTTDRDARSVLYVVRDGSPDGDARTLDDAIWTQARAALARAHAGTGTIWRA